MLITINPTANQTPDVGQGGSAVTGNTNTGHGSTVTSASNGSAQTKTCRWFTFPTVGGTITAITLKVDHTSSGTLSGASNNAFTLQYSLNNGGAWTTAVSRGNFTASQGPTTFSVGLSVGQDISQVQVRDFMSADSTGPGDSASVTATIANVKLEVTTVDVVVVSGGM